MSLAETVKDFEDFKTLFNQPNPPLDKCNERMKKLKVAIARLEFPTSGQSAEQHTKGLLLASKYDTFIHQHHYDQIQRTTRCVYI